jgi:predicted metal-dependent HD superfamily phosphohydrolase
MILATIKHEPPQQASQDLRFFLDFDLAILGSEFSIYQAYAQKIRQEYAIFADELYIPGRIMVLEKLLDRPRLFQTEPFYDQYEEQARNNLHRELLELKTKSV